MIALLIAAASRSRSTIVVTPFLIRVLRARGIGQLIRDDGPFAHPHAAKAGTPTMGGIAIVVGVVLGYVVAHVRTEQIKFARTGLLLDRARSSGSRSSASSTTTSASGRAATSGCASGARSAGSSSSAAGFASSRSSWVDVSTHLSFTRRRSTEPHDDRVVRGRGARGLSASSNGVNLTDGMDGLAAGSATLVFAAFTIICFWQFRHSDVYMHRTGVGGRPRGRVGRAGRRVRRVPVVERGARADLHGRHRLARDRRRDGRARAA